MSYTFGGPSLLRKPVQTCVGSKEDTAVYLLLETTVRVLVRVPDAISGGKADADVRPEVFEEPLRQACAEALIGLNANGFCTEMACVQQFTDGG